MSPARQDAHLDEFHRDQQWHKPVRLATTANITIATALNAGDTIDGVTLAADDRVLVKDQSTALQNGIYIAGATPVRAYDMVAGIQARGAFVYVIAGTANGGKLYHNTNTTLPTIDTDALTFTEFSGASGAPTTADYLVGTSQAGLSAEIVVGTSPGGELGGTWASPTVDPTHSGSAHADFIAKSLLTTQDDIIVRDGTGPARLAKGSDGQVLTVDPTTHHLVWATPTTGGAPDVKEGGSLVVAAATVHDFGNGLDVTAPGGGVAAIAVDASELPLDTLGAPSDITTLNASTSAHGLLKKLDNSASHFLDGQGNWSVPSGTGVSVLMEPFYGDGRDGNVTISADTTIVRDMYYDNLTVNAGKFLDTACLRVFVKGTLTLNGTIRNNGNNGGNGGNGTGAAGGSAGAAGTQQTGGGVQTLPSGPQSRAGVAGGINANGTGGLGAGSSTTYFGINVPAGATGGVSGSGRSGGSGSAAGTGDESAAEKPLVWPSIIIWNTRLGNTTQVNFNAVTGQTAGSGSGGGAAGAGGGGSGGTGSGGALIVLCAKTITGNGAIESKGGNGGNGGNGFTGGQAGGGAGGNGANGGVVVLIYKDASGWTGTIDVSGGTKGTGGSAGGGAGSTNGGDGNNGNAGRSFAMQLG